MSDPQKPDSASIQQMFDRLAPRYDIFNRLTSLGMDTRWREETLKPLKPGMKMLDLGCGTGDLVLLALKKTKGRVEIVGLDFSERMLEVAGARLRRLGLNGHAKVSFVRKRAEDLPTQAQPYDLVVSAFVLRNIYQNSDTILGRVHSALKDGGRISFVDMTEPSNGFYLKLWRLYMHTFGVFFGRLLFGKNYPATYITDSARRFLKPREFVQKLRAAGFKEVTARPFLLGCVVLYQGTK